MTADAVKKMSDEKEENQVESNAAQKKEVAPAEDVSGTEILFELNEPLWAVVTFEDCAAKNLTYEEAFRKMEELKAQDISGLCIVTDEVAERIGKH